MSIESVMPSSHLILCCPLLLLPALFPSIRVFPKEPALRIGWPKSWSFSLSLCRGHCEWRCRERGAARHLLELARPDTCPGEPAGSPGTSAVTPAASAQRSAWRLHRLASPPAGEGAPFSPRPPQRLSLVFFWWQQSRRGRWRLAAVLMTRMRSTFPQTCWPRAFILRKTSVTR